MTDPLVTQLDRVIVAIHSADDDWRRYERMARAAMEAHLCRCDDIAVGSFAHTVTMQDPFTKKLVGIDVCIATEIADLWHQGICSHVHHDQWWSAQRRKSA